MQNEEQMPEEGGEKWSPRRKWGLVFLVLIAVCIVGGGIWQFSYRIKAPFAGRGTGLKNFKTLDQKEFEAMVAKQKKDTDNDGLTDFDEEYVYKTSQYLDDSDSDGYPDKVEIETGNDPNCPVGKSCGVAVSSSSEPTEIEVASTEAVTSEAGAKALVSGQATPAMVRAALRQAGVAEEVLNQLDDATLMETYREVLKETNASGATQNAATGTATNSTPAAEEKKETTTSGEDKTSTDASADASNLSEQDVIDNMTPAQARALLKEMGVDDATLNSVDDATLMKILKEAAKSK